MYFVFLASIIAIILTYCESKGKIKAGLKYAFILMTLVSAFRYGYGSDYFGYILDFKEACSYSIEDYLTFNDTIREPGWWLLMKLFQPLGCYVFFAFLAVVTSLIIYKFIKENVVTKDLWIAMSIYLLNFDLYVLQQSMMRQAFAMAIFVSAFRYIGAINKALYDSKKKDTLLPDIIKLSLLITLMAFIHQSSMVVIPIALVAFVPLRNGKLLSMFLFAAFCLLWVSSRFVAPIFENLMALDAIAFYGEKYIDDDSLHFGIRQILSLIPFFVALYYLYDKKTECSNRSLVVISMMGTLVLPFAGMMQLIGRVAYYFDIYTIAAYPIVYRHIRATPIRYLLLALVIFIDVYMWFDKCKNPTWEGSFLEYHTLFKLL